MSWQWRDNSMGHFKKIDYALLLKIIDQNIFLKNLYDDMDKENHRILSKNKKGYTIKLKPGESE